MDEIRFIQQLARSALTLQEPLPDLRFAVRREILARQRRLEDRRNLMRLVTVAGSCGLAAAVLFAVSVYAVSGLARDLAWNGSIMHLMSF